MCQKQLVQSSIDAHMNSTLHTTKKKANKIRSEKGGYVGMGVVG